MGLTPRLDDYRGLTRTWRGDVLAGVTVGIVALPLALAFGVASGVGAGPGIITAIVAGVVAAVFGGSHVQVSGPTGAMTVVLVPLVARHGAEAVVIVGVLAGLLVVAASLLRLGRALAYIPWPVIEGFTLGIAAIIFLQQVPTALGVPVPDGDNTALVALSALGTAAGADTLAALAVVGIVVAVMVGSPRLFPTVPASLPAVIVATLVVAVTGWSVAPIGDLPAALPHLSLPSVGFGDLGDYVWPALAVAALAAIESLLSARVADQMTDVEPHRPDRELFGQGLANIAASLFGGMPATGAIARTAVNLSAGGRTRLASITHAVFLVVVVVAGAGLVSRIPLAALAGVLMVTAVRMVDRRNVRSVVRATRTDAVVFAATAASTIAFDLVIAVNVGIAVAIILTIRNIAKYAGITRIDTRVATDGHEVHPSPPSTRPSELSGVVAFRITGPVFFGVADRLTEELTRIGDADVVILVFPDLDVLDATGARTIGDIVGELEQRRVTVLLKGIRPEHERTLEEVGALDRLASRRHLFDDLDAAIDHARTHVGRATTGTVPHPAAPC